MICALPPKCGVAATDHGTKEKPYLDRGYEEVGEVAVPSPLCHPLFHFPQELAWKRDTFDQIPRRLSHWEEVACT